MSRRKRLSLAPEALEALEEVAEDQLADSRVAQAKEIELQKKNKNVEEQTPSLHGEQLSAYIQNCVKLSQDNKITIRNAFDLNLIDYMISFAKENSTAKDPTNFSLASMSLDASGKIYGYRVDAVHQDVFRLISGLGGQKNVQSAEIPDAPDTMLQNGEVKKPKKKRVRSTYIAEDGANEGGVDIDYEICGNDILTTVHHNDGNALGRIMSYNLIPFENQTIDLEGNSPWWAQHQIEDNKIVTDKIPFIKQEAPISTYLLDNDMDRSMAMNLSEMDPNRFSQGLDDQNNSIVFDPEADPIPITDDAPNNMPFSNDISTANDDLDNPPLFTSIAGSCNDSHFTTAGDFCLNYLQNFKSTGLNFAGPNQFRLKRFNILGAEKKVAGQNRGAKRRETHYVSFSDEQTMYCFEEAQPEIPKSKDKSKLLLSSITMDRWSSDSTTLTVEFTPSSFSRLAELSFLPSISVRQNKQKAAEDLGEERLIEYENDADDIPISPCADDHFSELGREGDHAERDFNLDDIEAVDNDFGVPLSQPQDEGYDQLVSAPGIVAEKLAIAYTKAAKKFNVRQMKDSYWKVLTDNADTETMTGERLFSETYSEVLQHLSTLNRKNISPPLAFVSMLMLCNEKHLQLIPHNGESDFMIAQEPSPFGG